MALAEKYGQPFEYFDNLDSEWVKRMFVVLNAEAKSFEEKNKK